MNALYQNIVQKKAKQGFAVLLGIACMSAIVAVFQGIRFSSSIWVIAQFGFVHWEEDITRMLHALIVWAIFAGVLFAGEAFVHTQATKVSQVLLAAAISFGLGVVSTYLLVALLALTIYVPLGMLSLIFPDEIHLASLGFAFLCSAYIVFLLIATDTPSILIAVIKKAPPYFKLIALLLAALLAVQTVMTILSIFKILVASSIWKSHLPAFVIAFGGTLIATVLLNLFILKDGGPTGKVFRIVGAFVLSAILGNVSDSLFHWGEYASAIVAATVGPVASSVLIHAIQRNIAKSSLLIAGLILGVGMGLLIANIAGIRIVGQDLFGVACGSLIVAGLGVSLGFILGPRIGEVLTRVLRLQPIVGVSVIMGFVRGTVIGMLAAGFVNRR